MRLARAGRADDRRRASPGGDVEATSLQRAAAARVAERRRARRSTSPVGAADRDRVGPLVDLGLGVEQLQRAAQGDELLLQAADRVADLLQRLVERRRCSRSPRAARRRSAGRCSTCTAPTPSTSALPTAVVIVDDEREQRLAHRQARRAPSTACSPCVAEARVLVALAAEGDDHAQHRHRLVDDRQRLALEVAHVDDAAAGCGCA